MLLYCVYVEPRYNEVRHQITFVISNIRYKHYLLHTDIGYKVVYSLHPMIHYICVMSRFSSSYK